MRQALAIGEVSLGPDHLNVASYLNNLAQLLKVTKRSRTPKRRAVEEVVNVLDFLTIVQALNGHFDLCWLAVKHDVIPLDGADVFQQGEIDSIDDRVALTQDPGDFARLEGHQVEVKMLPGGGRFDNSIWWVDDKDCLE